MEQKLGAYNLIQQVEFITWTRTINGQEKKSVLDHIYTANPLLVTDLKSSWPVFTDHALVQFMTSSIKSEPEIVKIPLANSIDTLSLTFSSCHFIIDLVAVS